MAIDTPAVKTTPDLRGPSFSIISKEITVADGEDGRRRFRLVASSSIEDKVGDEIEVPALQKAAAEFRDGVTIFMDHDFKHVESAFGVTDSASVMPTGVLDPGTGKPVYDLVIEGLVNTPNPRAKQLSDSIDQGVVKLGASLTAFVTKHARKAGGRGMLIKDISVVEASVVGVAENQRSWALKAALAVKSFHKPDWLVEEELLMSKDAEIETEGPVTEPEEPADAAEHETEDLTPEPAISDAPTETPETVAGEAAEEDVESPEGGQASDAADAPETPETAPDVADTADDLSVEKAASVVTNAEVKELLAFVTKASAEIGRLREENATLISKVASLEAAGGDIATEVEQARSVISKVLELPLRSQTAGFVEDFKATHPMFAPEVQDYLTKRSKLSHE